MFPLAPTPQINSPVMIVKIDWWTDKSVNQNVCCERPVLILQQAVIPSITAVILKQQLLLFITATNIQQLKHQKWKLHSADIQLRVRWW